MSEPSEWARDFLKDGYCDNCQAWVREWPNDHYHCDACGFRLLFGARDREDVWLLLARALDAARAEGKAEGAAAEREACAMVADEHGHDMRSWSRDPSHSATMQVVFGAKADCAWFIAAAIRARGDA